MISLKEFLDEEFFEYYTKNFVHNEEIFIILCTACFLDPKYKKLNFLLKEQRDDVLEKL